MPSFQLVQTKVFGSFAIEGAPVSATAAPVSASIIFLMIVSPVGLS
jgi:hypothetical protein